LSGDAAHAANEYRAFLAAALSATATVNAHAAQYEQSGALYDDALGLEPDDNEVRLSYARSYLQQGKLPESQALLEKVVKSAPDDAKARLLLGQVLFAQRNYAAAREQLEAAVVASPTFEVGYLLGITYIKLNDLTRARQLFDEMALGLGDTAQLHLYFGRAYREGQSLDNAIKEIKKAITKDPKLPQAHYLLAVAYLSRDSEAGFPEAIPELEAELKLNPDDPRTHYLLGYIALKQHRLEDAQRELRRSVELDPQNPDPLIYLGQMYAESDRDAEAEATMRRAIALTTDPSRNDYQINRAHYVLARILMKQGHTDEGEKELAVSKDLRNRYTHPELAQGEKSSDAANLAQGEDTARAVQAAPAIPPEQLKQEQAYVDQLKPAIADAYNNLGVLLAGQKEFAQAAEYFRKAGEWNPALEMLDRNRGLASFYANQYADAIAPLSRQLSDHADDLKVRAALGLSYFMTQKYPESLQTLQPIQLQVDDDPGLAYAYAVSLVKTGDYNNGIARLRKLSEADPKSADLHMLLGEAFADQGEHATALQEYAKSIALDPNQAETHYLAGLSQLRQGSPADAVTEFRAAVKLAPNDPVKKYHLAFALIEAQQKDEAFALLQDVIKADPKYADAYYELGKLQLERGDAKSAIGNLETGIQLSPDSDYIHYQLAMAYRRDSRASDAEREIKLYQTLKNQHRGRDDAQPN
jgi:tetratricopeptide (TPR) repeat protein